MKLEIYELINGMLSFIFVLSVIIVGLKIIIKYFQFKRKEFIFIGLTGILLSEPWWPSSISFLLILFTGDYLSSRIYFFVGFTFLPLTVTMWLYIFTEFNYKKRQKSIVVMSAIMGVIYEILFLYFLFTTPSIIGDINGPFDANYGLFVIFYQLTLIVIAIITSSIWVNASLKSENSETRLKGKLLLCAIISFTIGTILDVFSPFSLILLTIARTILIISAIEFYLGFILPNWARKLFFREK